MSKSKNTRPINIRRELKYILKDYQRRKINNEQIEEKFKQIGVLADIRSIKEFLKLNIPGRILTRLGRAAKKSECLIDLMTLNQVANCKKISYKSNRVPGDYHLIPFLQYSETEKARVCIIKQRNINYILNNKIVNTFYSGGYSERNFDIDIEIAKSLVDKNNNL